MKKMVKLAIADYAKYTCIRWVPWRGEEHHVEFFKGDGCFSQIGMAGLKQQISLADGCLHEKGVAIHEMMHALGFFHEQSRLDRDKHIKIIWRNIKPKFYNNFEK